MIQLMSVKSTLVFKFQINLHHFRQKKNQSLSWQQKDNNNMVIDSKEAKVFYVKTAN